MEPVIAVDPGLSGAVALYDPARHQMHVWRDFKSVSAIADAANAAYDLARDAYQTQIIKRVIEFVHAYTGQGVSSCFSFGKSTGAAFGALFTLSQHPIEEITPQAWQTWVKKNVPPRGDTRLLCEQKLHKPDFVKFDSRVHAVSALPDDIELFKRAKDHNSADAALMAIYTAWKGQELTWAQTHLQVWDKYFKH